MKKKRLTYRQLINLELKHPPLTGHGEHTKDYDDVYPDQKEKPNLQDLADNHDDVYSKNPSKPRKNESKKLAENLAKNVLTPLIKYIKSKGLNPNSPMISCIPCFPEKLVKNTPSPKRKKRK